MLNSAPLKQAITGIRRGIERETLRVKAVHNVIQLVACAAVRLPWKLVSHFEQYSRNYVLFVYVYKQYNSVNA